MMRIKQKTGLSRRLQNRATRFGLMALVAGLVVATPAQKPNDKQMQPEQVHPERVKVSKKKSWFQVGKASWYGPKFNGRQTAMGERYDMNGLTCAHRSLPLGSWVRVTNMINRKTAFLRVNDRGPMSENLIVDLSYGAARKLGISGLGKVKIEAVRREEVERYQAKMREAERPRFLRGSFDTNDSGVPILSDMVAFR